MSPRKAQMSIWGSQHPGWANVACGSPRAPSGTHRSLWVHSPEPGVPRLPPEPQRPHSGLPRPLGVLSRCARHLGRPSASLTMARPGCPERGKRGTSGGGSSCSSSRSAARPRLHTQPAARATAAAARPNGPSPAAARAQPRPAPPLAARASPHCGARGSLRSPFRTDGPADRSSHTAESWDLPPGACSRSRRGLLSVAARPGPCVHSTSSLAEGYHLAFRSTFLCEPRQDWTRPMAEMRRLHLLVWPSLQCVKLGRATVR